MDKALKQLKSIPSETDKIIKSTLLKYARLILADAMANLPEGASSIRSSYHIDITDNGFTVKIYTDNEIAAYLEFGTGDYAKRYLSGQPDEVSKEAIKFLTTGKGTMEAQPYLFPAYYKYRDQIVIDIKKQLNDLARRFNNA